MHRLLDNYTALDLTDAKGQLCGRFLADLGMRVIKVEPPAGDPLRRRGPFHRFSDGSTLSFEFAHLNANKESLTLDLEAESGRLQFCRYIATVDVVIENHVPGYLDSLGIGYPDLVAINPALVLASITGYGQTGPRANYPYSDIVAFAMSGLMFISGDPLTPPCNAPGSQGVHFGSLFAALGVLAALERRKRTARGDHVDVSLQETLATQEQIIRAYANDGLVLRRAGSQHANIAPANMFPCTDGYVYLYVNRQHWKTFLQLWTDHPDEFNAPQWEDNAYRRARAEKLNDAIAQFSVNFSKSELTEVFQSRGVPCMPVNRPAEFVADSHVQHRKLLTEVTYPRRGAFVQVSAPIAINGTRLGVSPAPEQSQPREEVIRTHLAPAPGNRVMTTADDQALPLSGVRVLTFDHILAGPFATTLLAELGAEVIKVESRKGGLDPFRFFSAAQDPDLSPRFWEFNRNKRSITINLKHRDGPKLIKELIPHCDAVLDNFSVRIMPSLGLTYEDLCKVNPGIIAVRMPSLGSSGPKSKFAGVGSTITAFTGFTYLWNHAGAVNPPIGSQGVYPDYVSGTVAATAILAALEYRNRTGQGLAIDLSQAEAAAYMIAPSLMQAANLDEEPAPVGNRSRQAAPQGCYPCKGSDRWLVISVESDQQWRDLANAIGRYDLLQADHLHNAAGRHESHDQIDQIIAAWTIDRDCYDVMETLTNLGIPAGVVQNGADLLSDSHLRSREFFVRSDDTRIGPITLPRFPVKFKNCPLEPHWQFSELGRDTEAVLQALLGYDGNKIESMKRDGLLE